jgi:hypothetical protein
VVIDLDRTSWNLVQALAKRFRRPKVTRHSKCTYLADNAQRFSEFLHSTEISIITIAILADGNIELDLGKDKDKYKKVHEPNTHLVILVIGRDFSKIPLDATATQHDARKAIIQGLLRRYFSYVDCSLLPNPISSYDLFDLIHAGTELRSPMEYVVEQTVGQVKRHTTRTDVSGVQSGAGHTFVKFHQLLALFESP